MRHGDLCGTTVRKISEWVVSLPWNRGASQLGAAADPPDIVSPAAHPGRG